MPSLKEAAVAVTGQVMDLEVLTNFETKKREGRRAVLATGDGFASVKIRDDVAGDLDVKAYDRVTWMVRFGAWSRGDQGQTTCAFVRVVTDNDLDLLVSGREKVAAGK